MTRTRSMPTLCFEVVPFDTSDRDASSDAHANGADDNDGENHGVDGTLSLEAFARTGLAIVPVQIWSEAYSICHT